MATAEKISSFNAQPVNLELERALYALQKSVDEVESNAKRGKSLKSTTAPNLDQLALSNQEADHAAYVKALLSYMMNTITNGMDLMKQQSITAETQVNLGDRLIVAANLCQQLADKKLREEENSPWAPIIKILAITAGALMVIAGAVSEDPALAFAGVSLIVMTATDAGTKLNQALSGLDLGWRILAEIGIALGGAAILSAAGGVVAVASNTATTAATTAATAAVTAAEAGVEMAAIGGAAEAAADAGAVGAENVASSSAASAEANASSKATNAVEKGVDEAAKTGSKWKPFAFKAASVGAFIGLPSDSVRGILEAAKKAGASLDKEQEELGVAIGGAILALVMVAVTGMWAANSSPSAVLAAARSPITTATRLMSSVKSMLGNTGSTALYGLLSAAELAKSGMEIAEGNFQIEQAKIKYAYGDAEAAMALYDKTVDQNGSAIKSSQSASHTASKNFVTTCEGFERLVQPWMSGVENMA